jgi:hypothetical protein
MKESIVTILLLIGIFSSFSFADSLSSSELQRRGIVNVQEYIQKIRETGRLDINTSNKALDNLFQSIRLFKKEKKLSKIILSELNIAKIYRINKIRAVAKY